MIIYNDRGEVLLDIVVDDESFAYSELCGDDYVKLQFSLTSYVELPAGAYIVYNGVRYTLIMPDNITKHHSRDIEYTVIFEAPQSLMGLYVVSNVVDGRVNFSLTGTPQEHLQLIVDVLNERDGGWSVGACITGTAKTITYNKINCDDALQLIAQEFDTEYETIDKSISLGKVLYHGDSPLPLSYGNGNGFLGGVRRTNWDSAKSLGAVYAEGSERNIDASKYGSATLHLPKQQTIRYDGNYFEDEELYDEAKSVEYVTDIYGYSVRRIISVGNRAEGTLDCTEIYPSRVGKVTSVVVVSEKDNSYDIIDSMIPASLDYRECQVAGNEMTIVFQSGMLAGREFSVAEYKHAERRFLLSPRAYDGVVMPNESYCPHIGDEYAVFGIALPDAYICDNVSKSGASWDMLRKCVRYLYDNEKPQYSFAGDIDSQWAKENWMAVQPYCRIGAEISFSDAQFNPAPTVLRVVSVKQYINDIYRLELGLGQRPIQRNLRRGLNWMRQDVSDLRNNNKANKRDIDRTLLDITAFKAWKDKQGEALEGVEASVAIKIYKQQLAEIEAEFASIESLLGQKMPKPIEWLDYLDAYNTYKSALELLVSLKNPDSINIAGIDTARSKYVATRDALLRALGVDDARILSKQIYEGKIAEVTAQRNSILQELFKITGEGYMLVDSEGDTLADSTGALLYEFVDNSEYGAYNNAANAYIAKMREMIDTLNFIEDDDYRAVSEAYYAQYNNITSKKASAQAANMDFIRQYIASTTLSSDVIWTINTNINTELLRLFYDAIVMELDIYEKKYPDIPSLVIQTVYNYKVAAKAFISIIEPILKNATDAMCQLTTSYQGARDKYRIRRNDLILYEIQNK